MHISAFRVLLIFVVMSVIGIALLPALSVQLSPSERGSELSVQFRCLASTPLAVEQGITARLEAAISTVQGIKKLESVSYRSGGTLSLSIDEHHAVEQVRFEVASLIRQVYPQLPRGVSYPQILWQSPDEETQKKPLLTYTLQAGVASHQLQQYAEQQLKPRFANIEGLHDVEIYGGTPLEWVLEYNPAVLQSLGLEEEALRQAIEQHFGQEALGVASIDSIHQVNVVLRNSPSVATEPAWSQIVVTNRGGRLLRLSELVRAKQVEQPAASYYRVNGLNTINLVFVADAHQNSLRTASAIHEQVASLKPLLPSGYTLSVSEDSTEFLKEELQQNTWMALASLGILVVFVWLSSRSRVYLLIIGLGLVANLALAVILFYAFRTEIHLYSLAALTTSLGIVIDNSIVMIDHYRRYRDRQVFLALLGATLTNLAGLSVIYFLPERVRLDLLDFASVLIITLVVSLVVALWLVPALMSQLNFWEESARRPQRTGHLRRLVVVSKWYHRAMWLLIRFRSISLLVALLAFGLPVFWLPDKLESNNSWASFYNQTLGNEWYKEYLRPDVNRYLGGTLRLFSQYVFESSFYTQPQETTLYVNATLPNGYTLEQMNDLCKTVEKHLATYTEVDRFVTQVYSGQAASIAVYFRPSAVLTGFPYVLKSRMIALSLNLGGAEWDIYGVGQGFSNSAGENPPSYLVTMYGYNYEELERQAMVFQQKLLQHPRIQSVDINQTTGWFRKRPLYEFLLQTDPQELALNHVSKARLYGFWQQTSRTPQADLGLIVANQFVSFKLIPSSLPEADLWYLNHQPIRLDSARRIKSLLVAKVTQQRALPEIRKENQQYIRVIGYEYMGSAKFGDRFLEKTINEMQQVLPLGYSIKRQDFAWWSLEQAPKQYGLVGLTIVLIYFVCVIIFESLKQPLAIIGLIPLSFTGVFIAFYFFDFNFDQGGYASFLLLSGNVVNAGIFIVNEFNIQQKKHPHRHSLRNYLKAFHHKIIPILLTVLSTVVGFVPFLWAGPTQAFWFALAVGSVAGLLMSLVVIFLYLPVFLISGKKHSPNTE